MEIDDIFLKHYPQMDLHGVDRDSARMMTNDFVNENVILENSVILIMHGIGSGIVKQACHDALRENKNVVSFKTDNFNHGLTIVELKKYS